MGAPKPCLGYATRTEAVAALTARGLNSAQIVACINDETPGDPVDVRKVTRLRWKARERRAPKILTLRLKDPAFDRLKAAAGTRGTTTDLLARRLIEAALADSLIDAILDDGGDA